MVLFYIIYGISLMLSVFAVSGLNLNGIFKSGHIWEAKVFTVILIISITHILAQFAYTIINTLQI